MRNLNLLFNKEYYQKLGTDDFKSRDVNDRHIKGDAEKKNEELTNAVFVHGEDYRKAVVSDHQHFVLKILYPGLLIGIGNPHGAGELGDKEYDINMGFSFDYVTGQPYIPGSSVKGVLRSHFKYHTEAVVSILKAKGCKDINVDAVKELENYIFDYSDIFFDAVVFDSNDEGKLLGFDYVTPHSSATKNPIPVKMIKILPGVRFEFRFKLKNYELKKTETLLTIEAETICALFEELLILFGAGAKTNVGYGIFEKADETIKEKIIVKPKFISEKPESRRGTGAKSSDERIKCPGCGFLNYRFNKAHTRENKYCYKCKTPLR